MDQGAPEQRDPLDQILLDYDEALCRGNVSAARAVGPPILDDKEINRLRACQRCLLDLESMWPRGRLSVSEDSHSEAIHLCDDLKRTSEDLSAGPRRISDVDDLKRAITESGLISREDLELLLADLAPEEYPDTIEKLAYELVQHKVLEASQIKGLCTGELPNLVLGNYVIQEQLGYGGMGIVYKALCRRRDIFVALKTLYEADAASISRLKSEFRVLSSLAHENLVALDELRSEDNRWFFTMELIEGSRLTDYVRGDRPTRAGLSSTLTRTYMQPGSVRQPDRPPLPLQTSEQFTRLRDCLRQLGMGLEALHQAGILHRDLKPSNILVTKEGRLVLVDFGLAVHQNRQPSGLPPWPTVAGTTVYMSPEQFTGKHLSAKSDWYSVGVVLYELLTGQLPFAGDLYDIAEAKQKAPCLVPPVGLPEEAFHLFQLCCELLAPSPEARPTEDEILDRIGARGKPSSTTSIPLPTLAKEVAFVGRTDELRQLDDAFGDMKAGRCVTFFIDGPSGIGKTALVRRFLHAIQSKQDVLVLRGRCYERESVPYKALDGVIDALAGCLRDLPREERDGLLPGDFHSLTSLFPILGLVPRSGEVTQQRFPPEERELLRLAVESFRSLLFSLARRQPTIIFIDDLQWGDLDSTRLLNRLLAPPAPPPVLLVGCYRARDDKVSPSLEVLLEGFAAAGRELDLRKVRLRPLAEQEIRLLAASLTNQDVDCPNTAFVARESAGNPYFVAELSRYHSGAVSAAGQPQGQSLVDLDDVIVRRVRRLPADARHFLEVIATAGDPVTLDEASRTAQQAFDPRTVARLRAEHLISQSSSGREDRVETFHDRIREAVCRQLSDQQRQYLHAQLAAVLERSPGTEAETLFEHYRAAGLAEKAATYALAAAERADGALAFDRAARLYQYVFDMQEPGCPAAVAVRPKLAEALSNAGYSAEAARHLLAAADLAESEVALEYRRRAAGQFFRAGRVDEGLAVLQAVLAAVGLKLPRTRLQAVLMILVDRLRLRLRGKKYGDLDASTIARDVLLRIDTGATVCWDLSAIDALRGFAFGLRFSLLAFESGERCRTARGLVVAAGHDCFNNRRTVSEIRRNIELAGSHADQVGDSYAQGYAKMYASWLEEFHGNWCRALQIADEAESIFRDRCRGAFQERGFLAFSTISSLFFLGRLDELTRRVYQLSAESREREDWFGAVAPETYFGNVAWLRDDRIDEARSRAREVISKWPRKDFLLQHMLEWIGSTQIDLYVGDGLRAWNRVKDTWPAYRRSFHAYHQFMRIHAHHLRARAALALAQANTRRTAMLRSARRDARKIEHERMPWADALARLIRAGIAAVGHDETRAVQHLKVGVCRFEEFEMHLYLAAARRRLGALIGGEEGESLVAEGTEFMADQRVVRPDCMTRMLIPGFE